MTTQNLPLPLEPCEPLEPLEPILDPKNKSFIFDKDLSQYPDIYDLYTTHVNALWHSHEVHFKYQDRTDWDNLNQNDPAAATFIKNILAFFALSDVIVNDNITAHLSQIQILEIQNFYKIQEFIETVHSQVYVNLLKYYITDKTEYLHLCSNTIPAVKYKTEWAINSTSHSNSFAKNLVCNACIECLFFTGEFAGIYWILERQILPGLKMANDFISKDEALHVIHASKVYSHLNTKLSFPEFKSIVCSAVEAEIKFITAILPEKLIGMNSENMILYIKHTANYLSNLFGYPEIYTNTENPFKFMIKLNLSNISNFFEKTPTEYSQQLNVNKNMHNIDFDKVYTDV